MMFYQHWKEGTTYSFDSISAPSLPRKYTGLKLNAVGTFRIASAFANSTLYAQWRIIYPSLPNGTPDAPESAKWLIFEASNGELIVLADNWIDGSSVTPIDFTQAAVLVTETNENDINILRDFMNRRGMKFQITIK